jgi:hypothetical protein
MTAEQAIKANFYGEGADAGTATSRIPLLDAAGNPIGSATMAHIGELLAAAIDAE